MEVVDRNMIVESDSYRRLRFCDIVHMNLDIATVTSFGQIRNAMCGGL